jgi:SAM-dependent methyltransferase
MSVAVLRHRAEIDLALGRLRARGLQPRRGDGDLAWLLGYVLRTGCRPPRPDAMKSWDVELTIEAVTGSIGRDERIVDLGAYNSAVLPALARLGYTDLVGVDLDPNLVPGPRRDRIEYRRTDFYSMPFLADESCGAVTAVSTIEHGWRGRELFSEVGRILRPGGLFVASADYWPEKLDTSHVRPFEMSWTIFSATEIRHLLDHAESVGLTCKGDIRLDANERTIHWSDRDYTFVHMVLQRG